METMFKEWLLNEYGADTKDLTRKEYDGFYAEFIKEYNLE